MPVLLYNLSRMGWCDGELSVMDVSVATGRSTLSLGSEARGVSLHTSSSLSRPTAAGRIYLQLLSCLSLFGFLSSEVQDNAASFYPHIST